MRTLGWMQKRFGLKTDEQSRNVSTRKSFSCFSSLWELDEQQYSPEAYNNSTNFRLPAGKKEVTGEETVEFFHGFLAIGTLGSVSITKEPITPFEITTEKETIVAENELQSLTENFCENDTKENRNTVVYPVKECSGMTAIKEHEKEQKTRPDNLFKKNVKSSGKLGKGVKRETHSLLFMKKMLKKLDFTSHCSPTIDSTERKLTKVFQKSRKVHPEAVNHATKPDSYEVKKMCKDEGYDKQVKLEDENNLYPHNGMFANNSLPAGKKARWIKTDVDYFVLEF